MLIFHHAYIIIFLLLPGIFMCAGILFLVTVQQAKMLNTSLCVDNEYSFVCLCEFNEFQVAKKTLRVLQRL